MGARQRRAVWLLGASQCLLWGVLYYSFAVLLLPIERELGMSRTAVAGAFSLALLATAGVAPAVGRWADAGHAALLVRGGIGCALGGLALVGIATEPFGLYAGWLLIGLAMATLLYEPAFVLVARSFDDAATRVRALAAVTVLGGLASSASLPLLALAVEHAGWRSAVGACAAAVVATAVMLERGVLPVLASRPPVARPATAVAAARWPPQLGRLALIFGTGTFAAMALTTLLIPLLVERGESAAIAAVALGMFGIAQLPGRIWLLRRELPRLGSALQVAPVALQAAGLIGVVVTPSATGTALGVALFGLGAGLQTLVRPWLVDALYGRAEAGRWNGEIARVQGLLRASGPVLAAAAAWLGGPTAALAAVAALLLATVPTAWRIAAAPRG